MTDHSTRGESPPMTSPWPILVAVGFVAAEVGIVLDLFPVAVGGLVLLARSLVGILTESGYLSRPRPLAGGLGVAFVLLGATLYALGTGVLAAGSGFETVVGLSSRGLAIATAGVLVTLGAAAAPLRHRS